MTGIDEVILCDNKAKNAGIAIDTVRLFDEVSVQKNESKLAGYFITIPKYQIAKILSKTHKSTVCMIRYNRCGFRCK